MKERTKFLLMLAVFGLAWFLPVGNGQFLTAVVESLKLVKWYAQEHVLLCLIPAFFIAGAISVFVSQGAVVKYLGPSTKKIVAYPVAAASGAILAVCSCTVLPLFSSIHKRGAGLGPASAFLYSGPAINVLAIILTARILGPELGLARTISAILFSVLIGLVMHFIFRKEAAEQSENSRIVMPEDGQGRKLWQNGLYFFVMVGILIFANWGKPEEGDTGVWDLIHSSKWLIVGILATALAVFIWRWFKKEELVDWADSSWMFAKQIMPLLLAGVAVAGFLLGGPDGGRGVIPSEWISSMVGENSLSANLFASVAGAFMYFATLTEVPILKGLLNAGMGKGPALALLLSGPALSLPNMLVIRSVMGTKKTLFFVGLVVIFSTTAGVIYGAID